MLPPMMAPRIAGLRPLAIADEIAAIAVVEFGSLGSVVVASATIDVCVAVLHDLRIGRPMLSQMHSSTPNSHSSAQRVFDSTAQMNGPLPG